MNDNSWKILYRSGGIIAWITLIMIPIQIAIYLIWPPPTEVLDFFRVYQNNALIGLINLDFLYLFTVLFMGYLYLAFFVALNDTSKSLSLIALVIGLIGVCVYFISNVSFEMLSLSKQYALTESNESRKILITSGKVMLTKYSGTAFGVYYILNGISLILFSIAMIRNAIFSNRIAYFGLVSGILMLVPTTVGIVGMAFGLTSLIPTSIWLFMMARRLNVMGKVDNLRKKGSSFCIKVGSPFSCKTGSSNFC